jgi:negative regulator of sigma E activity
MSAHPDIELLELLARGQGSAETQAHVDGCAECTSEVAWLHKERALVAQRPEPDVSHLWAGIEERVATKPEVRRRPHWYRPLAAAAAVAAAAMVILFVKRPQRTQPPAQQQPVAQQTQQPQAQQPAQPPPRHIDPKSLAALETAEKDYRHAATVLEEEYATLRPALDPKLAARWDETLTRARASLGEQQKAVAAQDDVRGRMRVLDGYAEYLRSLRDVIENSEEAVP